jgi:hypothetical protein
MLGILPLVLWQRGATQLSLNFEGKMKSKLYRRNMIVPQIDCEILNLV